MDEQWQKEKLKLITELEKKLDAKQALDLEIEFLKGALQITTHMEENRDMKITMEKKKEELEETVIELESLEALNEVLVVRERKISDELQEVRKELISVSIIVNVIILIIHNWNERLLVKSCLNVWQWLHYLVESLSYFVNYSISNTGQPVHLLVSS